MSTPKQTPKMASKLLEESATPFDAACMIVRDMELELERLRSLAGHLLDPEMYGFAVTAEVRDAARYALGKPIVETKIDRFKKQTNSVTTK